MNEASTVAGMVIPAYLLLFCRLTLGLVFGLSGATKLVSLRAFLAAVREFQLLPHRLVRPFAIVVLVAEVGAAAALLGGVAVEGAAVLVLTLLALFTAALVHSLRQGRRVACRCLGELSARPASWGHVLRNAVLAAVATGALWSAPHGGGVAVGGADLLAVSLLALTALALLALISESGVLQAREPREPSGAFREERRKPAAL